MFVPFSHAYNLDKVVNGLSPALILERETSKSLSIEFEMISKTIFWRKKVKIKWKEETTIISV